MTTHATEGIFQSKKYYVACLISNAIVAFVHPFMYGGLDFC